MLDDVLAGGRLLWRLVPFLRNPLTLAEARATVQRRLADRETDFLALARRTIYSHARSPYRRLLAWAGCEYGDLERLVRQEGLEAALRTLHRQGVYLTVEEFKGRRPAVRGGESMAVDPHELRNPAVAVHLVAQSSGSRGQRAPIPIDLGFIRDHAAAERLVVEARRADAWRHAVWNVPGGITLYQLFGLSAVGARVERWFSQIDPAAPGLHPRYRYSARAASWASTISGVPLPRPEPVSVENPLPIARWMASVLRSGETPHVRTLVSSAVRLAQTARAAGIDLRGSHFTVSGEPITEARRATIAASGGEVLPRYGCSEAGILGHGCLAPEASDEVHLVQDMHAIVQPEPGAEGAGLPPRANLLSSLRATAPVILLNVSLGDQALLARRACGCPLDHLWPWHVSSIRSYEKLTSGGMTFLDQDVVHVLEHVLPSRLGGGPTDYQLVEEEADDGRPRLRLLVHPRVGPLDTLVVKEAFLDAIGAGSGVERVMSLAWRDADLLRIERRTPVAGASGKILHLHLERSHRDERPGEAATRS